MSQQPPPPYGGPPSPYPPNPYGDGQPHDGMSNKAKFWIGVALSIPALIVVGLVSGAGTAVVDGLGGGSTAGAVVSTVIGLGLLATLIALLVFQKTRWFAVGILAGLAILLILLAGACVVLIVVLSQSFS